MATGVFATGLILPPALWRPSLHRCLDVDPFKLCRVCDIRGDPK